jgi:hypothetical protein
MFGRILSDNWLAGSEDSLTLWHAHLVVVHLLMLAGCDGVMICFVARWPRHWDASAAGSTSWLQHRTTHAGVCRARSDMWAMWSTAHCQLHTGASSNICLHLSAPALLLLLLRAAWQPAG